MEGYVQKHGFLGYFKTSAKDGKGIEEAGKVLITEMLKNDPDYQNKDKAHTETSTVKLKPHPEEQDKCNC